MLSRGVPALVALLICSFAFAQQYPAKLVRISTYATPGGGFDRLLRVMADELSRMWGQTVLVDNRPGAVGMIQAEGCAKSAPDGYTVCLFDRAQISMMPHLYKRLPYDPARDFEPVTTIANLASVLAISATVPADSVKELLELAKAQRGALNFGSLGVGTHPHMVVAWINKQHGTEIVHVPYKSAGALVQALSAGEIQMTYFGLFNLLGPIRGGKLKALAVSTAGRSTLVPNVPTFAEAGLEGLDGRNWIGLFVPTGTAPEITRKIQQDVARVFAPPEFRERHMVSQGWEPILDTPEDAARAIRADRHAAAALVKISGAQLD